MLIYNIHSNAPTMFEAARWLPMMMKLDIYFYKT